MKNSQPSPITHELIETIGHVKDGDTWTKSIIKIRWGDNSPSIDIRNVNLSQDRIGKGISLSNEEVDTLVDILLTKGYGSLETIQSIVSERKSCFTTSSDIENVLNNNNITRTDKLVINIE